MQTPIDLLQIKIEKAKGNLPEDTQKAIAAVDWKMAILEMRAKKGYTFEQLGDLELETELLLSGLLAPEDYPRELEKRMGISRAAANKLVNEMNDLVFKKIREELIKNTERKRIFAGKTTAPAPEIARVSISEESQNSGTKRAIETPVPPPAVPSAQLMQTEKLELQGGMRPVRSPEGGEGVSPSGGIHPTLAQKLSGSFQIRAVETDHSLKNMEPPSAETGTAPKNKVDPYREIPE